MSDKNLSAEELREVRANINQHGGSTCGTVWVDGERWLATVEARDVEIAQLREALRSSWVDGERWLAAVEARDVEIAQLREALRSSGATGNMLMNAQADTERWRASFHGEQKCRVAAEQRVEEAKRHLAAVLDIASAVSAGDWGEEMRATYDDAHAWLAAVSQQQTPAKRPAVESSGYDKLWEAIDEYVKACGGRPKRCDTPRSMDAVCHIEGALFTLISQKQPAVPAAGWRKVDDDTAFLPPFGTVRACCHCGCLVAGGPAVCARCATGEL